MQLFLFLQNQHPSCPNQYQSGIEGLGFLFALPIMPSKFLCAPFRLDCHTILAYPYTGTHGSFQRDSAGAGHSCRRFRLHDRRLASYSSQRLDAPAVWCSVFPPSFAARRVRPLMPRIVGWCSTGGILHTEGVAADAPTPSHPCEGGRGMGAQGHTLPHSHFRIYHALRFPHEGITATFSVK